MALVSPKGQADGESRVFFARVAVPNQDGAIRAGMEGRGKISAGWQTSGYVFFESRRCGCIRGFGIGLAGEDEIHEALEKIADGRVGRDGIRRIGLRRQKSETAATIPAPVSCAFGAGNGDDEYESVSNDDMLTITGPLIVEHQVDVTAQREGIVAKVTADSGARVSAGTVLARLDDRQLSANLEAARAKTRSIAADLKNWEAEAEVLKADYVRAQRLCGTKNSSPKNSCSTRNTKPNRTSGTSCA